MVTIHVDALAGNYVVTELRPWKVIAEPDGRQKVDDVIMT
jgi:hypothetical protein